ncbi:hypothetical protein L1987_51622 [Smallanthus sonchifolius]|uniref:Uncharacterized protein n=1 Tax=Smallanthus sonchifolius TaxID=185202 RepID=A0ACB9ERF4_9ASTR|nr:hypothetical protein L1987_51622 [Smallanthus sonchifolius]
MGSLMAGWRSHVHHLQSERNRSLTKEEITSFWRSKRKNVSFLKLLIDSQRKTRWISSKWAFLNEPPKWSWETSYKYVAQFHIARKHIESIDLQGISA